MSDRAFHPLQVTAVRASGDAGAILSLQVPPELQPTYTGLSGQHIVVRAHLEGAEVRRTYSLISPAGQFPLQIAVRRHEAGAMSGYLTDPARAGEPLEVMPPTGSLHSRCTGMTGRYYLGLAAGCGITAVLSVLTDKLVNEPLCRVTLVFGNRNTARTMCLEEVMGLKDRFLERLSLHFLMSREPQLQARFNGRLDARWLRDFLELPSIADEYDEAFVCVPGVVDGTLREVLRASGVEDARIHTESFEVNVQDPAVSVPKPVTAGDAEGEVKVAVVMDGRRRSFVMSGASENLLEAALDAGVDLPYSCCGGVCSTCRARVVEGSVDMAQNYALEDWEVEAGFVLVCQSKPLTSTIVLDYDSV